MSSESHLRQALEALGRAARERLALHPMGHLVDGPGHEIELRLPVPLAARRQAAGEAAARAERALEAEIEALITERAAFRPGRIFCLRCASAECEHSAPADSRQVFAGYGPSGMPRFSDFAQWLLERKHPDIERLYESSPRLLTDVASGRELVGELLPAFRDGRSDYRVHGQVAAGWFRVPRADRTPAVLALTFQILSAADRSRPGRRRLALNLLGAGPDGERLDELYLRLERIPWSSSVHWAQSVLASIERSQDRPEATPEVLSRRVEGVLRSIARRLEQGRRARDRRTGHAQRRHAGGDRPTRMAIRDLERAGEDGIFADERHGTLIVLGERGRAHVWSPAGKLVTSIRYSPESIARKRQQEVWRQAGAEEIAGLRRAVEKRR